MKYRIKEYQKQFIIEIKVKKDVRKFFGLIKTDEVEEWERCGKDGITIYKSRTYGYINPPISPFETKKEAIKEIARIKGIKKQKKKSPVYWDEEGKPMRPDTRTIISI